MNFTFFHRPEMRKYGYKPQFYVPEEEKPTNYNKYDRDEFGEKLHRNWENKRRSKNNPTNNMRTIVWLAFLIAILGLIVYVVFNKLNL